MTESSAGEAAIQFEDQSDIGGWLRDQAQLLIDRSVSNPLGFVTALATLIFAGSIGFLIAVVIMPWWMFRRRKYLGAFGAVILLLSVVVAGAAPLIQTVEQDPAAIRVAPYTKANFIERFTPPNTDHVMGTDNQGRDIVTRMIYGSEVTVLVGFGSVIATAVLSTLIGLVSGYFAGTGMSWAMRAPPSIINLNTGPLPLWWFISLPFALLILFGQILLKLIDVVTLNLFSEQIAGFSDDLFSHWPSRSGALPDIDLMIQRVVDIWNAFPAIFLILAVLAVLGSGGDGFFGLGFGPNIGPQAQIGDEWFWQVFPRTTTVILTVALVLAAGNSRIVRGAVLATRASAYVEAARSIGASNVRIMVAHIVPNIMATIIVLASLNLGAAVLIEAAISFLGFGIPPPFPTWGRDTGQIALVYATEAWWLAFFPGLMIMIAVFGFNMMGDALRDILDPRLRGT